MSCCDDTPDAWGKSQDGAVCADAAVAPSTIERAVTIFCRRILISCEGVVLISRMSSTSSRPLPPQEAFSAITAGGGARSAVLANEREIHMFAQGVPTSTVDHATVELEAFDGIAYEGFPIPHACGQHANLATIIQAAEKAAEAGNFASAEKLLREAARLQEERPRPRHPDLANTLNNLGIVCEMTGKPDDAEQYFRRAVSIATNVTASRTIRSSPPARRTFVTFVRRAGKADRTASAGRQSQIPRRQW